MDKIKLFIEGFIIGLGKIMPGVSGSLMAICFGVYEKLISCFSSLKSLRKNFSFFLILGLGISFSIIVGSNMIKILFETHFLPTLSFFIGMMVPGILSLFKNVKNTDLTYKRAMICILTFTLLTVAGSLSISSSSSSIDSPIGSFISLVLCGLMDAGATIVPGISGSALLMIVGFYDEIIGALASPFSSGSLFILIPFIIGFGIGVVVISKLIAYLFNNYRSVTYMFIITISIFSVVSLGMTIVKFIELPIELLVSIIFIILGIVISLLLEKIFSS